MPDVHFYLKSGTKNKKGQKTIIMVITHNYLRPVFFIHEKVNPKYWNKSDERVREPKKNETDYTHINETIDAYRKKAYEVLKYAADNEIPLTEAYLKSKIMGFLDIATTDVTFFGLMDEYITYCGAIRAERTVTGYTTVKNFLLDFEKWNGRKLDLNTIDQKFFEKLVSYAFAERKIKDNYFSKIVRTLKSFLNWANERNDITDITFRKFKATEREKDVIYLTIDELMKLNYHNFKEKKYDRARDLYCFMCFTGMRISDIQDLKHEHIIDGQIVKVIVKTTKEERIPLNDFALEILQKYNDNPIRPLPKLSDQRLNTYIKTCCEKAKINTLVNIVTFSGSKKEQFTKPKHKLITNQTARKTFVTNSLILGMNAKTIKSITGHKKDSIFNKYLKIAEDYKKIEMGNTWNKLYGKNNADNAIPEG